MQGSGTEKKFQDMEIIFKDGQSGDEIFFVTKGEVMISKNLQGIMTKIAEVKEGEFFGEMALFKNELRSATAMAKGRAKVVSYKKGDFLEAIKNDPEMAFKVIQTLSERLTAVNEEMVRLNTKGLLPKEEALKFSRYTYS